MSEDGKAGESSGTPAGGNGAGQDFGFFATAAAPSLVARAAPPGTEAQPQSPRGGPPVWAICASAAVVVLVVLGISVFLNHRDMPVMPSSVGGRSKSTDPFMTAEVEEQRKEMRQQLPGQKVDVQGYGNGVYGYKLMGFNMRLDPTRVFSDFGVTSVPTVLGDVRCAINADTDSSLCIRTGTKGGIVLVQLGWLDLERLAAETAKVWSAQHYGD